MQSRIGILVLATALAAAPATAQETRTSATETLLWALRLPQATQQARLLGVPERDLRSIFDTAREMRLPAGALTEVFDEENKSIREHGPVDNFGAFVQARLGEGLRGRELAAAIRAEHAARGKGKGYVKGQDGRPDAAKDKGYEKGQGDHPDAAKGKGSGRGQDGRPDTVKGRKGGPR
jgi:hypothetical protein